ncbi:DUF2786 domain-containing protein [Neptunomonas japonica]|uniref:DUF2786 domain-containing protein n=1 Tax=Neptunomonas japonica TaxID=417574 RepID=UPI0004248090|nr:DUF2786 domain-containing protein [Neptunomonas japonica]
MSDEKILSRIKNLLAMAGDLSSPNEAVIAARRARSLMDKHQISKKDLLKAEGMVFGETTGHKQTKNKPSWLAQIAASIAYLNDCECITQRSGFVSFNFRGFKADAVVAKHMHDYIVEACERLLEKTEITGRSERNFYRLGFADEIARRILAIVKDREKIITTDGKSLVICKKELIKAHFEPVKIAARPRIRTPSWQEQAAASKGHADAQKVSLDAQLSSRDPQCGIDSNLGEMSA